MATLSPATVPIKKMQFSSSSFIILVKIKSKSFLTRIATPRLACVELEKNLYLSLNISEMNFSLLPSLVSDSRIMSEFRLIIEATLVLVFFARAETFILLQF